MAIPIPKTGTSPYGADHNMRDLSVRADLDAGPVSGTSGVSGASGDVEEFFDFRLELRLLVRLRQAR
jgi:hypothetical protein